VVEGEDEAGRVGVGLSTGGMPVAWLVSHHLNRFVLGRSPAQRELIWDQMYRSTLYYGRKGLAVNAISAVDLALWDLVGKALGQPLWRLWGGYCNCRPMIAIGGYYGPDADIEAEVAELREMGLAGMKFKVGGATPEADAERFRRARAAAGPDFALAADANQGWTPQEAIRFARLVEDQDLLWLEEPCNWHNDRAAMRDVR
jgi:D-arabinonate dehydratase